MNLQAIGKDLFNKIRGRFPGVTIGDSEGKITNKPEDARFFDFEFKEGGNVLGKVSISISEEDGLVVLHNKDFVEGADDGVKTSWYNFLKEMGQFAKARVLGFDTRDITKSNLEKRDYEYMSKGKEVDKVSESNLFGTTKTSFQSIGEARLVIKHSRPVDQSIAGGRTHRIESIFIESSEGERFKYPIKHLNGARAMARHVSEGGKPFDSFGKYITGLSEELSKLKSFKTYMNRSNVMAEGLREYQSIVDERIDIIKNECVKLQRPTNYKETFENFKEADAVEVPEDIKKNWIDELTIKTFKEELQDVFPYIYKLVTEKTAVQDLDPESFEAHGYQGGTEARRYEYDLSGDYTPEEPVTEKDIEEIKSMLQKAGINADVQSREDRYQGIVVHTDAPREEVEKVLGGMIESIANVFDDFEDAMEQIVDEGNALFSQDPEEQNEAVEKLNQLMQKHFPVGVNGTNGIESLQGIIDDEDFNNAIEKAAEEDSDMCMRPMIMDYIKSKDPQLASRIETGDMKTEEKGKRSGVEITPELKEKVQAWWDKYSKYEGGNGNTMPEGYLEYALDSGIGTDAYNADEYIKVSKEMGMDNDDSDAETEMDQEELMNKMPITKAMFDEIVDITGKSSIEDSANIVQDVVKHFVDREAITFEDIKPYVSMYKGDDGKMVYDVLDKDGKSVQKFDKANAAMKYLHANFDELRYGSKEKEAMVDPEGNPQYGDESKEIALDQWNNMSKEEKEEYGSFSAYLKSDDFQAKLDHLRSKFEKDEAPKPEMPNASEEDVQEFIKSFFDYTSNQFPKGETAILTAVEKKFGDAHIRTAQEAIHKMTAGKDQEIEKIKKLAGVQ